MIRTIENFFVWLPGAIFGVVSLWVAIFYTMDGFISAIIWGSTGAFNGLNDGIERYFYWTDFSTTTWNINGLDNYQIIYSLLAYLSTYFPFSSVFNTVYTVFVTEMTLAACRAIIALWKLIPLKAT